MVVAVGRDVCCEGERMGVMDELGQKERVYELRLASGGGIKGDCVTMPPQLLERVAGARSNAERCELLQAYFDFCYMELEVEMSIPALVPLVGAVGDADRQAGFWLLAGVLQEKRKRFAAAAVAYRQGYVLEPSGRDAWYFMNNNLGFCLCQVGRFKEAEGYCRAAIRIEPARSNGYKNLGLALQAQGRLPEAAGCFIEGVHACPEDIRNLSLLRDLVTTHPQVRADLPGVGANLVRCEELVKLASVRSSSEE